MIDRQKMQVIAKPEKKTTQDKLRAGLTVQPHHREGWLTIQPARNWETWTGTQRRNTACNSGWQQYVLLGRLFVLRMLLTPSPLQTSSTPF